MGCDWIRGSASYGYVVKYELFSQKKITGHREENESIDWVLEDDEIYFKRCWIQFWKWYMKANGKNYDFVYNIVECDEMAGLYDTGKLPKHCHVVFGYGLYENTTLDELKYMFELPKELPKMIAKFLYLFNKTEFFPEAKIPDSNSKNSKDEEDENAKNSLVENSNKNQENNRKMEIWNREMGNEPSDEVAKKLKCYESQVKEPRFFIGTK